MVKLPPLQDYKTIDLSVRLLKCYLFTSFLRQNGALSLTVRDQSLFKLEGGVEVYKMKAPQFFLSRIGGA